jgi:amidase
VSAPASTVPELATASAGELARRIAAKEVTSREVVEALLERIEAVNPGLQAIRVVLADEALAGADAADAAVAAGGELGPLHGVPFTVKENLDVAGTATTSGLSAMLEARATQDAPSVAGLRAAGGIPIGRTNLAESGLRWHSYSDAGGHTVNPWDASRTPGGSSGGDAVALAGGMTPLGVGNDLGGSLRIPSQFNGTVALKPSLGRVGAATTVPPLDPPLAIQLMGVNGPMARTVADLRLALEPISAPDPRDPWQVPAPLQGPPAPRRVAVALWDGVHADVAAGVRRAADALATAGWEVEDGEPPRVDDALATWTNLVVGEVRAIWSQLEPVSSEDQRRFVGDVFENVPALDFLAHGMGYVEREALGREWGEWMQETPLVLAPPCAHPPFEVGFDLSGTDAVAELLARMRMIAPVNLLGVPAVAVGAGLENGLPQGVQVIGPRFREDLCLEAAQAIETALGTLTPIDPR